MRIYRNFLTKLLLVFVFYGIILPQPFTYAATAPGIVISTPGENSVVSDNWVEVQGYVTDTTVLRVNGNNVSFNPAGFFSCTVYNLNEGSNVISLTATGSTGLQTTKNINVFLTSSGGSDFELTISNPATSYSEVFNDQLTLTGTVDSCEELRFSVNKTVQEIIYSVDGPFSQTVTLPPGDNEISVDAMGGGELLGVETVYVRYNDQGPGKPNIYNLLPVTGSEVTSNTVTVSGNVVNASSGGLMINGAVVSFGANGNFNKTISLNSGVNTITVTASNGVNTITKTINITFRADPVIVITSPADGQVVFTDNITVTGNVFNCETDKLFIEGERVTFNSSTGSFSKQVKLKNIVNNIEVQASNGGKTKTNSIGVWYKGSPTLTITSHTNGQTVNSSVITLGGTILPGIPGEIASFTINDVDNTSKVVNGSYESYPVSLQPGENTVEIELITLAQGSVPATTITRQIKLICEGGAAISVSSPSDGATVYSNLITVKGKVTGDTFDSLTVDGKSTDINSAGGFQQSVEVENGKNEIEIKATYGEDNITKTLVLYYNSVIHEGAKIEVEVKDGEEIKVFNDTIKIKLAKDSLGLTTTAVVSVADPDDLDNTPKQSALVGPLYRLEWGNYRPVKPYMITLKFDDIVRENQTHKVSVFYFDEDEDEWLIMGGNVDAKAKTISIETDKEGYYAAVMYFRTFDDVNNHWAQRDIEFLVAQGAVEGSSGNDFEPDGLVTRAEFVTFLVKALGWQTVEPDNPSYSDVGKKHWSYVYIETALRAGLVSGVSHSRFAPDRYISREEAGVILARAANLKTLKQQEVTKVFSEFGDGEKTSPWARYELAAAIKAKVLSGSDNGLFMPDKFATRGQAAAMVARLKENYGKTKKTGT